MIWVREEGRKLRTGFNFYPMRDERSIGFVFRLGRFVWRLRWSKVRKRLTSSAEFTESFSSKVALHEALGWPAPPPANKPLPSHWRREGYNK